MENERKKNVKKMFQAILSCSYRLQVNPMYIRWDRGTTIPF